MSTLQVEICKIEKVELHPNADRLEIIQIKGWNCVVQKDSFHEGALALYIPIDSILPEEIEEKIFGKNSKIKLDKHRVRTIKLRKVISQGLVIKPEIVGIIKYKEGENFTDKLGILKYEPPVEQPSIYGKCNRIKKMYLNSNFHKYTDIENIKNYTKVFQDGEEVYISEKLHGTSFRCGWVLNEANTYWKKIKKFFGYFPKYEFIFGSRNVQLNSSHKKYNGFYDENIYAKVVVKYDLYKKLQFGEVLYGEIVGDGIQSGYNYGLKNGEVALYVYDIMLFDKWLDEPDFNNLCYLRNFPVVPLLYRGPFNIGIFIYTNGASKLAPNAQPIREGCVIKSVPERLNPFTGRTILKSINEEYLLKDNSDFH